MFLAPQKSEDFLSQKVTQEASKRASWVKSPDTSNTVTLVPEANDNAECGGGIYNPSTPTTREVETGELPETWR